MTNSVIKTTNLTKRFGQKTALNDLSLNIEKGGIHSIVGSNGAGKSTLFRTLLGFSTPTSGAAHILGQNCQTLTPETRRKVGFVNEEHTLPTWMLVRDVKEMQRGLYPQWNEDIYNEVIANFDVHSNQKVGSLSRGERAGFNLSMALAQSPELLILDEPTLGLDVVAKRAFLEALMFVGADLHDRENATIIYCSHQMDEIERVADQLIIMEKGILRNQSSPDEFLGRVDFWIADFNGIKVTLNHPAILSGRLIDGEHHICTIDQGDTFADVLKSKGACNVQRGTASLDQAVNAFLAQNHKKHIPQRAAA